MKPSYQELKRQCPDVPDDLLRGHLERLDKNYYGVFTLPQVKGHLQGLACLAPEHPVEVLFEERQANVIACTVLAYDYPSEFSLITGVLSATGFDIVSGNVFTYSRVQYSAVSRTGKTRRLIIDRFIGAIEPHQSLETWKRTFTKALSDVIALLDKGTPDCLAEARRNVNEMVSARLAGLRLQTASVLYPVNLEVSNAGSYTRLRVLSQDTPAFLYALSSALALQNLSIEQVRISTVEKRVQDEIDILDISGNRITDNERLDKIKISILLTKQFTYFLGSSPDPYTALCRFEKMLGTLLSIPDRAEWIKLLSAPEALQGLARLLGASDYMWEDFVRLQYETLLPMLKPSGETSGYATEPEQFFKNMKGKIAKAKTFEKKIGVLNEFKDSELFLIDLDQILNPAADVRPFSASLTKLAEMIVRPAAEIIFDDLRGRFGVPRTIAGFEVQWAIFGLGKFGGAALGYASDIELLLVFSDNGRTDGQNTIENSEYFGKAALMLTEVIRAKREGIFHVDIRLRPYGESGPFACSLESFCKYYGPNGPAHSYERLALVRLRAVAGDEQLGRKLERLRDEFVYSAPRIKFDELRELREKQFIDKAGAGRYNAKFSPGALVDLEYDIQLLQVMHGAEFPGLKTPYIHEALDALSDSGILGREEGERLAAAYYFFRRLINGLRMLRGSARDLFLPPEGSLEYAHLARRMGYRRGGQLEPEQQLRVDFETRTAVVRAFIERHFGRDSLPGRPQGNIADLILSDSVPVDLRKKILSAFGFKNIEKACRNLRALGGRGERQNVFAPLAVLAGDALKQSVDPDRALNNWEQYVRASKEPLREFELLLAQPKRLEILLGIFSASQFLADTLIRNPEFFNWVTTPEIITQTRSRAAIEADLRAFAQDAAHDQWLNAIRRFRCREILRIGARDICLHAPIREITADLSSLAEAMVQAALEHFCGKAGENIDGKFCILAFGKLGGRELNYSSDIDLLSVYDACPDDAADDYSADVFPRAMEHIAGFLSGHTTEGHAYRVDFRLRPYGRAGQLAYSLPALLEYYREKAAPWEIQALLKMRPIAGSEELGRKFLGEVRKILMEHKERKKIIDSIEIMRGVTAKAGMDNEGIVSDIKNGAGGIRDIEFLVQGLQIISCPSIPELINGNTFDSLTLLAEHNLLSRQAVDELKSDYELLRRVEHCLQIFEDRQVHILPDSEAEKEALAKRILGYKATAKELLTGIKKCQTRVRNYYRTCLKSR